MCDVRAEALHFLARSHQDRHLHDRAHHLLVHQGGQHHGQHTELFQPEEQRLQPVLCQARLGMDSRPVRAIRRHDLTGLHRLQLALCRQAPGALGDRHRLLVFDHEHIRAHRRSHGRLSTQVAADQARVHGGQARVDEQHRLERTHVPARLLLAHHARGGQGVQPVGGVEQEAQGEDEPTAAEDWPHLATRRGAQAQSTSR